MAITIDWQNKLVLSTASITDIVAHHDTLRAYEESETGILYPPIISYKVLDLGGGAYFYGLDYINGYQLKFPNAGNYTVIGNIGATIVPVAGVYVDRTKSAAFATVAGTGGSTGPTAEEIATAVWAESIEAGFSAEQMLRLMAAVLDGKVSGAGTGTEVFKGIDGVTDRVTATVDASGNRIAITLDPT